mgnify:CR=1 FL=1
MVSRFRVIIAIVGFFIVAGAIGNMDVTNTITVTHMILICVGFVYMFQSLSLLRKEF